MAAWSQLLHCSCYELGHTWHPSCLQAMKDVAFHGYLESFKVYAPLYLLAALLRRKKKDYYKKRLLPQILQSTLFLGTNAFGFIGAFCLWRLLVGRFNILTSSFLPAFTACYVAINLERKSRRGLLAIYLFNLATETAFRMLVSRKYITPVKNGEVLFFSIVTSIYAYLFRRKDGLKQGVLSGLKFILGTSELPPSIPSHRPDDAPPRQSRQGHVSSHYVELVKRYTPDGVKNLIAWLQNGPQHKACRHQDSCLYTSLKGFGRMFGLGYSVLTVVRVLGALRQAFKKPMALLGALVHPDSFNLGMFLGSFSGLFQAVSCLLRWLRNKDSELHGLVAGFVAGWSMMWYKSSSIAMYMASKMAEILYFKGIENGFLPYIKWGDVLLYSLSTSFVFHVAVFEPHNLRPAYWKFLLRLTNGKFGEMNRKLLQIYGTDADRLFKDFYPKFDPRYTDLAR